MAIHSLKTTQNIPVPINEVWEFFSSPANLQVITPKELGFKIISEREDGIYSGQIIEYTVKPLLGIPVYWMTEITHVGMHQYFVDEQRHGPYSMWHHKHHFREIKGGTQMTDIVHYKIPLFFIGGIINSLIVKKKLQGIFDYRFNVVERIFGVWPEQNDKKIYFR
ncbi:MAG: SRPBCC family protein [Bacteroidota bacterium]|jgi:ligand-binding SRPBCC domain-containing protein|nr:SRPBCC family protein [Bacteroidota bacterium]